MVFINLLHDNSVSVCCWWPLFVDAGQLALTDGLRDKCHAGNVKQHQFYTVALLGSPQGAGTPVCACFAHTLCKKINKQKTLCCLLVCVCVLKQLNLTIIFQRSHNVTSLRRIIQIFSLIKCKTHTTLTHHATQHGADDGVQLQCVHTFQSNSK